MEPSALNPGTLYAPSPLHTLHMSRQPQSAAVSSYFAPQASPYNAFTPGTSTLGYTAPESTMMHTVGTTGTRVLREHRYKKNKAIVKRQRPGCCGGCNAYCCRGGVCDFPNGSCYWLNCMGCCDRQKTIIKRVDQHLSEEQLLELQTTPKGCCGKERTKRGRSRCC